MTHREYTDYFRSLAENHPAIGHSPTKKRFARIVLSVDEMGNSNLAEFVSGLRSAIRTPFMLLAAPLATYEDNISDNIKKHWDGMMWLLTKAPNGDFDREEEAFEQMETIAEQVLARMRHDFAERINDRYYSLTDSRIEKVAGIEGFLGVRLEFKFFTTANAAMRHNPNHWNA